MAIHWTRVNGRRRIRNESTATIGISTWEKTTQVMGDASSLRTTKRT